MANYQSAGTDTVRFQAFDGTSRSNVGDWRFAEAMSPDTYYSMKLVAEGSTFRLYVDWNDDGDYDDPGEDEGTKIDTRYPTGQYVGIYLIGDNQPLDWFRGGTLGSE